MTTKYAKALKNITHPKLKTKLNIYIIPKHTLSIYHTNIRSLPDKYDTLKEHLAQYTNPPDIIAITDNYLKDNPNQNSYPIQNYTTHHKQDITTYIKNTLHYTIEDNINIQKTASIIIQIHENKQKNNPTHTIINLYRRPNRDSDLIDNLQETIDKIHTSYPNTTITIQGDINSNLLKISKKMHIFLIENNLHTTITTPTRYDTYHKNTATLIDITLTTRAETQITAGTISPPLSDHLPTYTIFHNTIKQKTPNNNKILSINQYNKQKENILTDIKTALIKTQNKITQTTTTSEHFKDIQRAIQESIEKYEKIPKTQKTWITPKYKRQIKKQHKLHDKRIKSPTLQNIQQHSIYRNKLNKKIKEATT